MKRLILSALFVLCLSASAEAQYQYGGLDVQTGYGTYNGYGNWSGGYGTYYQPNYRNTYYGYQSYPTQSYGYGRTGPYGYYYQSGPNGASWWNGYGGGSISVYNPYHGGYHNKGW